MVCVCFFERLVEQTSTCWETSSDLFSRCIILRMLNHCSLSKGLYIFPHHWMNFESFAFSLGRLDDLYLILCHLLASFPSCRDCSRACKRALGNGWPEIAFDFERTHFSQGQKLYHESISFFWEMHRPACQSTFHASWPENSAGKMQGKETQRKLTGKTWFHFLPLKRLWFCVRSACVQIWWLTVGLLTLWIFERWALVTSHTGNFWVTSASSFPRVSEVFSGRVDSFFEATDSDFVDKAPVSPNSWASVRASSRQRVTLQKNGEKHLKTHEKGWKR